MGEEPSLTLRVDDNRESSLDEGVTGDTLRIGLDADNGRQCNTRGGSDRHFARRHRGLGGGRYPPINLGGSTLELQLSGSSDVDGAADFESMMSEISGASNPGCLGANRDPGYRGERCQRTLLVGPGGRGTHGQPLREPAAPR